MGELRPESSIGRAGAAPIQLTTLVSFSERLSHGGGCEDYFHSKLHTVLKFVDLFHSNIELRVNAAGQFD